MSWKGGYHHEESGLARSWLFCVRRQRTVSKVIRARNDCDTITRELASATRRFPEIEVGASSAPESYPGVLYCRTLEGKWWDRTTWRARGRSCASTAEWWIT